MANQPDFTIEDIDAALRAQGIDPNQLGAPAPVAPAPIQNKMADQARNQILNPTPTPTSVAASQYAPIYKPPKEVTPKVTVKAGTYDYNGKKIDLSKYSQLESVAPLNQIATYESANARVLSKINEVQDLLSQVREDNKKLRIKHDDPLIGKDWNKIKDAVTFYNSNYGKAEGALDSREVENRRFMLEQQLADLRALADKGLTGNKLGAQTYKLMEELGIHPNLQQGLDRVENRINNIKKTANRGKVWAEMSTHTNRIIPEDDIDKLLDKAYVDEYDSEHPEFKNVPYADKVKMLKETGVIQ